MPQPLVGDVVQVTYVGTINNQTTLTSLFYGCAEPFQVVTIEDFYNSLWNIIKPAGTNDLTTPFLNTCGNNFTLNHAKIQLIAPARMFFKDFVIAQAGKHVDICNNQNVCCVISKRTGFGERGGHGRWRLPGLPDTATIGGLLDDLYIPLVVTLAAKWMEPLLGVGAVGRLEPCIYHPFETVVPQWDAIRQTFAQADVRTQRTRNIGKGI